MRTPILIALGAVALALTACDQRQLPTVAGLGSGGGTTATGGSTGTNTGTSTPLAITPNSLQLSVGTTFALNTNAPAGLQNQVQWRSAAPGIVAVNTSGVVTGLAPGTATITARYSFDTTQVAAASVTVTGTSTTTP